MEVAHNILGSNRRKNRPHLNWEVNLGHILIVVSMAAAVFTAYSDLRVSVAAVRAETVINKADIHSVKDRQDTDIREIKQSIRRIEDKLDAKADKS